MNKPSQEIKNYKDWYERASHDINSAELLFQHDGSSDTICYLVHQAVEKYLKGFLLFYNNDYPLIHDLIKLLRLCNKSNEHIIDYLEECKSINGYYIDQRYPVGMPWDYPKAEVKKVIEQAKSIIKYVLQESNI